MTCTPETLRKQFEQPKDLPYADDCPWCGEPVNDHLEECDAEFARAAADAWDADIQRQNDWHRTAFDLRKRLEAAERALSRVVHDADHAIYLGEALNEARAALAGEEKP